MQRRWFRKTRVAHQEKNRVVHEMAQMARMMDASKDFVEGLANSAIFQMAERQHGGEKP